LSFRAKSTVVCLILVALYVFTAVVGIAMPKFLSLQSKTNAAFHNFLIFYQSFICQRFAVQLSGSSHIGSLRCNSCTKKRNLLPESHLSVSAQRFGRSHGVKYTFLYHS